jgi:tRNA-splicing ligase RtcB
MVNLKKIHPATYILPKEARMHVDGLIFATEELLKSQEMEKALEQVKNVACLPGIVGYSIAMPDIHWGYGFPIGGVAAFDLNKGIISPGGVGYDINCGVRIALIPEKMKNIKEPVQEKLLKAIFEKVPSGVGHGHRGTKGISNHDYKEIAEMGVEWSIKQGFGFAQDIEHIESRGFIEGASVEGISEFAKERARKQIGTIGSGNHFIEIGEVSEIIDPAIAKEWKIEPDQMYVLIHSGSRGFGHQVCQDTLNRFIQLGYGKDLPDRQLVCAPIISEEGKRYFQHMAAAANFAFNNRQQILHLVREAFHQVLGINPEKIKLLYDICHNIAKFEKHVIDGKEKTLCVHRKGATRAFGKNHPELTKSFQKTGQPVLVPGDMGRASYLLAGLGNPLSWASSCHGAGRAESRMQSIKTWKGKDLQAYMLKKDVHVLASSFKTVAEEMPTAYKNIDQVVNAVQEAQLASIVVKMKPHLVIKG